MVRRTIVRASLLAASGLSAPLWAQTAFTVTPPARFAMDAHHVDHISGAIVFAANELSIGPDGGGGLSLIHYHNGNLAAGGPYGTNWDLAIYHSGGSSTYYVSNGSGRSDIFTLSGTDFTSQSGGGSTLTQSGSTYTYTTASGIKFVFDYTVVSSIQQAIARASKVIYPTGDTYTLIWRSINYTDCPVGSGSCSGYPALTAVRLTSVTSSSGYQFHYTYQVNDSDYGSKNQFGQKWKSIVKVTGINLAVDYCDPAAETCGTLTQAAPAVTYSPYLDNYGTVTDALNRSTVYGGSATSFTVRRPGSSATLIVR